MAAIVLAGGRSSRMGSDKALIEIDGERLLDRMVRIAGSVAEPVFVVAESADSHLVERAVMVGDMWPGIGPLGGIVTGLSHADEGQHIILACDLPLVKPALLALLVARTAGHDAAVPFIDGSAEPLCAVYDHSCLASLLSSLTLGIRAVHQALPFLDVVRVEEDELRGVDPALDSFLNLNSPKDVQTFKDRIRFA